MNDHNVKDEQFQGFFFHKNNHITFNFNIDGECREMLRISPEGFYIQGRLVDESLEDSLSVYNTFKKFLALGILSK